MAHFEITGTMDPFLTVKLEKGEKLFAESDAMVTMDAALELKGKMQGGVMGALKRAVASGESFFLQEIEAVKGAGKVLLAPTLPGQIQLLQCGARQYCISDGCYMASESSITVEQKTQSFGKAMFGGTGGFFVSHTTGTGTLAVSGFGAITEIDIKQGEDLIVDNGHVVAWDASLNYEMAVTTSSSSGGLFSKLTNSVTSGEGAVLRFSGNGKLLICSRNHTGFIRWVLSKMPTTGS